jgi:hypothetical protein
MSTPERAFFSSISIPVRAIRFPTSTMRVDADVHRPSSHAFAHPRGFVAATRAKN